jgi:antitoxin (DNA-binding transcriptional repressor) of toxin-antitoxin stability system
MPTLPLEQTDRTLAEIVEKLPPGEDVVLTRGGEPVATIWAFSKSRHAPRQLGTLKGSVLSISADFDEVPNGFEDYVP